MELCLYRCKTCGKVIVVMDNEAQTDTICCGEPMEKIKPFTSDLGLEKHLPEVCIKRGIAHVKVGSILHPSEDNHHIKIIALSFSDGFYVKYLSAEDKPEIEVPLGKCSVLKSVYCYCNVHGWWKRSMEPEKECKTK